MVRHRLESTLIALFTLCFAGAMAAAAQHVSNAVGAEVRSVARSNNEFGVALYEMLRNEEAAENLFFSPASISTALAMTYAGARTRTADEIRQTLRWTLEDDDLHAAMKRFSGTLSAADGGHALSLAGALWGQSGEEFLEGFLRLNRRHYGAAFRAVDFSSAPEAARATINDWAERNTSDRIKELLVPGDITPATALVLTNAVHFKGTWKYRFDVADTREASFRTADGRDVAADMMWSRGGTFRFLIGDGFEALALPYAGDRASMVVLLPDPQSDLSVLEQRLTAENIEDWLSEMRPAEMGIVMLPRFELGCRLELAETLREMGMPLAFSSQADFSGITTTHPLSIDDVIHKAFVQVNEEGTEAAAATAVKMKRGPVLDSFRADRPFIYLIQDHATGAILFMGRLVDLHG